MTLVSDLVSAILKLTTRVEPVAGFTTAVDKGLETKDRRDTYESKAFNPSSLCNPCMVQDAFRRLHNDWSSLETFAPSTLRLFAAGHAIHDHYQSVILPEVDHGAGRLWGLWRCPGCHTIVEGFKPADVCPNTIARRGPDGEVIETTCAKTLQRARVSWEYQEIRVIREDPQGRGPHYTIRGRADGIWVYPDGTWRVLELKSKDQDQFESMARVKGDTPGTFLLKPRQGPLPLEKDVYQGKLYPVVLCELARAGRFPMDPDKCLGTLLLYVDRNYLRERPFEVEFDPRFLPDVVDLYINSVHHLVTLGNPLVGPKACSNRNSARAKRCPWRLECFPYKRTKKTSNG
jgi:hypothetical protein